LATYFNINRPKASGITTKDSTGYQRTGEAGYLWRIPLDARDECINRTYNKKLDETTFVVSGIPIGSRPQKLWINGNEAFGAKISFEQNGVIAIVCLKRNISYNPRWEIEIISPALVLPQ
jgi:hypothetical protein